MSLANLASRRRGGAGPAAAPVGPANGVGVDLDGGVARVVEVRKGRVCAFETFVGDSPAEALSAWGGPPRGMAVTIAWSSGLQVARTNIPNVPVELRHLAISDAAEAMFPAEAGALISAGAASDAYSERDEIPATVVALRRETIAPVAALAARWRARVVPSPLSLGSDGLYVSLGDSSASVALVLGGVTVAYRELSVPAASAAASELDAANYLRLLVSELSATLASWESRGVRVPPDCFVVGPGSRVGGLARELGAMGLRPDAPPSPPGVEHYDLPASEISTAYLAICAACAPAETSIRLVDPVLLGEAAAAGLRARRRNRMVAGALAAVVAIAAGVIPLVLAGRNLASARRQEASAQAAAHAVSRYVVIAGRVDALSGQEASIAGLDAHYSHRLGALLGTAPAGTTFSSIDTQGSAGALSVSASATVPGSSFAPIATWVRRLEAAGATSVAAQSFSAATKGGSTVSMTLDLPGPKHHPSSSHSTNGAKP